MSVTTNLGMNLVPTTNPDYEGGNSPVALLSANFTTLDTKHGVEVDTGDGAIAIKEGLVAITKGTAAAMTLALPTAGLPAAGGDDGKQLIIYSETAAAHTVTTPTNGLNGAVHIATFAAAIGNSLVLRARNGSWWKIAATGITLS